MARLRLGHEPPRGTCRAVGLTVSTRDVPAQIGDLPRIGRPANSALLGIGVTTLDGVADLGRAELLGLHGVGPKAVRLLVEALAEQDRTLGP